jgi:hypothetical protein
MKTESTLKNLSLEMESTIMEIKNSLEGSDNRFELTSERSHELEDKLKNKLENE